MRRRWMRLLTPVLAFAALGLAAGQALEKAWDAYQRTLYQEALNLLASVPRKSAADHALAGKCYYQLENYKSAIESFEKAAGAEPENAEYHNWLGKSYGRRAENSNFLTAPRLAARARDAFRKAVALAPGNSEAVADLFEYYIEAPGFLGGGTDKAAQLAETIRQTDPAEYQFFQARMAEKRKDVSAAERHYRAAAALAPSQVGRLLDVASFLARQKRYDESDTGFRDADRLAPGDPKVLFARASAFILGGRNLAVAHQLLEKYLQSQLNPDLPSRKEAERLLRKTQSS